MRPKYILRHTVQDNLTDNEVGQMNKKYDFYCRSYDLSNQYGNPNGKGISHDYMKRNDGEVVVDRATNLMWQQSGGKHKNYEEAKQYIDYLNERIFAGYRDWRLPTLEEGMSLMEPKKRKKVDQSGLSKVIHLDALFHEDQEQIWTSDKHRASHGWVIFFGAGARCSRARIERPMDVRSVRSVPEDFGTEDEFWERNYRSREQILIEWERKKREFDI